MIRVFLLLLLSIALLISGTPSRSSAGAVCDVGQGVGLDSQESAFLVALNASRGTLGAGPLAVSPLLTKTAQWKAADMAEKGYFSHVDSMGRDPFQLMTDCGYNFNTWKGENILVGCEDAACALNYWTGSPGHEAVQKDPNYTAVGIARVQGYYGTFLTYYWAAEFGGVADPQLMGDVDCSASVNAVDALKTLRHTAGLSVTQNEPCRDIGA